MINCKYCKFWERSNSHGYSVFGKCKCKKFIIDSSSEENHFAANEVLFYSNNERGGNFCTGEEFGCIFGHYISQNDMDEIRKKLHDTDQAFHLYKLARGEADA